MNNKNLYADTQKKKIPLLNTSPVQKVFTVTHNKCHSSEHLFYPQSLQTFPPSQISSQISYILSDF